MIPAPPSEVGAVQVIVAWVFPAVTDTPLGTPATLEGLTAFDELDALPVPTEFTAETWKV